MSSYLASGNLPALLFTLLVVMCFGACTTSTTPSAPGNATSPYYPWRTITAQWGNLRVMETHHLTGRINGSSEQIDSTWVTQPTYNSQITWDASQVPLVRTSRGCTFDLPDMHPPITTILHMNWDTVARAATYDFQAHFYEGVTTRHPIDSFWSGTSEWDLLLAEPADRERAIGIPDIKLKISEDSTDQTGLVEWHEETNSILRDGRLLLQFSK